MPGAFSSKRNFLFDLDGTLIDSSPTHIRAYTDALGDEYPTLAEEFDYPRFAGCPTREVFLALGLGQEPELTNLVQRKQRLYREALHRGEVAGFPGAEKLLQQLVEKGRRLFVVTGASRGSVQSALKLTGLDRFFEGVVSADDAPLGKPDPQPYLHALKKFGLTPGDCLAIEDGEGGVRSAQGAGIEVVLLHVPLRISGVANVRDFDHLAALLLE
jgi:HAD superfamily hydrolase (TIGR01509 family)